MSVVIITGANRGLGLELARQYAADDWQVVALVRRSSPALDKLASGQAVSIVEANLVDDDSLGNAVDSIPFRTVDLLINCAGTMGDASFANAGLDYQAFGSFDRDEWQRVFDINVFTPMALSELLADRVAAASGKIVTFSSMLGSNALNQSGNIYAYRASKAAVNSIMKSMGINLAARGITAVAVHPGWVRTDMGGPNADLDIETAVNAIRNTIQSLTPNDAGRFLAYDGSEMPY